MKRIGNAYFVENPRTINDLISPHSMERERAYEIVKAIKLLRIDYENFISDMVADRQFIEENAALCSQEEPWRCLLVQKRGSADGVLVMPVGGCFVGWAAYYDG